MTIPEASTSHQEEIETETQLCEEIYTEQEPIPTLEAFYSAHNRVQFPLTALICCVSLVGLFVSKRRFRGIEFGLGAVAWLASETLKDAIFNGMTRETVRNGVIIRGSGRKLPTVIHVVSQELLRLGGVRITVALLPEVLDKLFEPFGYKKPPVPNPLPPLDELFFSALWLGAGWAVVENVFACLQFYSWMKLYVNVLPSQDDADTESDISVYERLPLTASPLHTPRLYGATFDSTFTPIYHKNGAPPDSSLKIVTVAEPEVLQVTDQEEEEDEIEERMQAIERAEVEAQFGNIPLYDIPVAVVVVWRLDALLLTIILTLVLSLPFQSEASAPIFVFQLWPTFFFTCLLHIILALLWLVRIPHVGLPSLSYSTLVILVALTFASLGAWGVLE